LMNKIIICLICLTALLANNTAICQRPDDAEMAKRDAAMKMADEYAQPESVLAQDQIVDPNSYIIGPGDELTIFFYGPYTRQEKLNVTPEGSVLIPEFGEVYLGQITLNRVKDLILNALKKRYRNIEISITLSRLRRLKVSVGGEVNFPGIYSVSSMDRVTEAVQIAGDLKENASSRNIKVFRDGIAINADLLLYARGGDRSCNPYLKEGDQIFVPPEYQKIGLLEIYGSVKLPGIYEYVPGDRISDLIMLAGGVTLDADLGSAELVRFDQQIDTTYMIKIPMQDILVNEESDHNLKLLPDDRLFIRSYPNYHVKSHVTIEGEVRYPGTYAIKEDTTRLTELVAEAGGFTKMASLDEANIYRYGYEAIKDIELDRRIKLSIEKLSDIEREYLLLSSNPEQGRISIDFEELFINGNKEMDIRLKDRDRIMIPKISNTVRIMGRVLKPGLLEYREGAGVEYYVQRAGGYTKSAHRGKIRIIKGVSGSILKPSSKVRIEVGDQILVPEKRDIDWWQVTKDVGTFLANLATVYIVIDQVLE